MNCGGIDRGGDVFEMQREQAGRKVDLANVTHEGDVGVVDGDGEIDLVFFGGNGGLLARGVFFLRLWTCGLRERSGERQKSEKHKGDASANVFVEKRVHGLSPCGETTPLVRTAEFESLAELFHGVPSLAGIVGRPLS